MKLLLILISSCVLLPTIFAFALVDKRLNVIQVGLKELVSVLTAKTERMHQILEDMQTMIDTPPEDENVSEKKQQKEQVRRKLFLRNHFSPKVSIGGATLAQHLMVVKESPTVPFPPVNGNNATVDKLKGRI